ncbi:rifin [Plasmodium falciparum Dd2]|uniref:Rifin n=1 Tax=Plasmodium falciparum (isolate Dd2) TaxID=57267 RepID=A0A0L7LW75_PLAF4|nr:rifin [Plasmodium falciparum Dd2]
MTPQMKEVMENFIKQTQQRFHDYDDRMKEKRKQCKERCDKEIQKIILKDKLEKQMAQQLTTLDPNITTEDIPTCICEKSLADKTEKFCLNCGKTMGGVAPGWGLVSGLGYVGWTNYVTQTALQKGIEEGVKYGIEGLNYFPGLSRLIEVSEIKNLINHTNYDIGMTYVNIIKQVKITNCVGKAAETQPFCHYVSQGGESALSDRPAVIADNAAHMAKHAETEVLNASASSLTTFSNAIIASIVAIVVIVLVMVIIYLILRYLRKKKMKKKLEYIKLLEE